MSDKRLHIVVATDSNYVPHTATLLQSISENHKGEVTVHVFGSSLNDKDREILATPQRGLEVIFYKVDNEVIERRLFRGEKMWGDRSLSAFARLLIPELLPRDVSRCVYMDVDAIVLSDLGELLEMDLAGFAVAGVKDSVPVRKRLGVGLSKNQTYINSGFILWNLEYCRENNVVDKFAAFISESEGTVVSMDQGTLNGVLSDKIKVISPKYNMMTSYVELSEKEIRRMFDAVTYAESEISEAKKSPVFVHFTPMMTTRPWVENCKHPLKDEYIHYRSKFEPGFNLQEDKRRRSLKIMSGMYYNSRWLFSILMRLIDIAKTPQHKKLGELHKS